MEPFTIERATDARDAIKRFGETVGEHGSTAYLAGGTSLVDQMKLGIVAPRRLVNVMPLRRDHANITMSEDSLSIGAMATMREVADHPSLAERFPAIVEATLKAASPQIRNVATIGGNLLQRTRCSYFRDRHSPCNKRDPGAGCAALGGNTRDLAVLGTSSSCIANYPGDLAVALVALDATVTIVGLDGGQRTCLVEDLHRLPDEWPNRETTLSTGDLITAVHVPIGRWDCSLYLKVRDRASYAFALASAAIALRIEGGIVGDVRIALGGLAVKPWRCCEGEAFMRGRGLDRSTAEDAATLCFTGADVDAQRAFKVELGHRTVVRALMSAAGQIHRR